MMEPGKARPGLPVIVRQKPLVVNRADVRQSAVQGHGHRAGPKGQGSLRHTPTRGAALRHLGRDEPTADEGGGGQP